MSDKIKNQYKNAYSQIEPRAEFLENLTITLEKEQATQKRSRIKMVKSAISAAACFAIVAIATLLVSNSGVLKNNDSSKEQPSTSDSVQSNIDNYGESLSISGLPIKIDDWDAKSMSADECAEFMENILCSDALSYILVSDSNIFTDAENADEDEIAGLCEMFSDCKSTDKAADDEERTYYMAVFEDGLIIKFNVIDDEYIEIPMKEIYLEIQ